MEAGPFCPAFLFMPEGQSKGAKKCYKKLLLRQYKIMLQGCLTN
jgi:hypothetical protein